MTDEELQAIAGKCSRNEQNAPALDRMGEAARGMVELVGRLATLALEDRRVLRAAVAEALELAEESNLDSVFTRAAKIREESKR